MLFKEKTFKNKQIRAICYGVLLGVVCQLHITPFTYSNYVVSLGTPVLSMLLLFQPTVPIVPLTLTMTVIACFLRGIIGVAGGAVFSTAFIPAFFYYAPYSILLCCLLRIVIKSRKAGLMTVLIGVDFIANALQLLLLGHADSDAVLKAMAVAVLRERLSGCYTACMNGNIFILGRRNIKAITHS